MRAPQIEIRGSGDNFTLLQNGVPVPRRFWGYANAVVGAQRLAESLQRRDVQDRPCLCCSRIFESHGRFNRLCAPCKAAYA